MIPVLSPSAAVTAGGDGDGGGDGGDGGADGGDGEVTVKLKDFSRLLTLPPSPDHLNSFPFMVTVHSPTRPAPFAR